MNPNQSIEDEIEDFCEKFTTVPEAKSSPFFPKNHQRSPDKGKKREEDLISPEDRTNNLGISRGMKKNSDKKT